MKHIYLIFYLLLVATIVQAQNCDCQLTISKSGYYDISKTTIKPGQKICISAGEYSYLILHNIKGGANAPVTVTNCGGVVRFTSFDERSKYSGIEIRNGNFVKLSGKGTPSATYGFKVEATAPLVSAVTASQLTSEIEIENVEIAYAGFAGIVAKTDPSCDPATWRNNFAMRNVLIHDNYVHNTYGEGIYAGNSFYEGMTRQCNGTSQTVYPHNIYGLKIYNNTITDTGAEGLQYACAPDAEVHHNTIRNSGLTPFALYQSNGLQVGGGGGGSVYNNIIENAQATGIIIIGYTGNNKIYNNLIIEPKESGILCDNRAPTAPNTTILFSNNTIVKPGIDGFRLYNEVSQNWVVNNAIIQPKNSGAYITLLKDKGVPIVPITDQNNLKTALDPATFFVNPAGGDYRVRSGSVLTDTGFDMTVQGVVRDLWDGNRPIKSKFDIGAVEYGNTYRRSTNTRAGFGENIKETLAEQLPAPPITQEENQFIASPNPTDGLVKFSLSDSQLPETAELFSLNGETVLNGFRTETSGEHWIDLKQLPAGIYLLKVTTATGTQLTKKIIRK
jgi:hypothetical protein